MKTLTAITVLVAAMTPALAASDPVSPAQALDSEMCHPIIGTVKSVHTDSAHFGTDIVLDHLLPSAPVAKQWIRDGMITVYVPADGGQPLTPLDSYIGQKVVIWTANIASPTGNPSPRAIALLSTALAEPKDTYCSSGKNPV